MKKFLPYILILTIVVQLFAPFTIGGGVKNNLAVEINKAEAIEGECQITEDYFTSPYPNSTETARPAEVTYNIQTSGCIGNNIMLSGMAKGTYSQAGIFTTELKVINSDNISFTIATGEESCTGGDCDKIEFSSTIGNPTGKTVASKTSDTPLSFKCDNGSCSDEKKWSFKNSTGLESEGTAQTLTELRQQEAKKIIDNPLDCSIGNFKGCVAWFPYTLIFRPTSAVFSVSGMIFDFAFGYSVQDKSYRSTFVVEGWGIVRDFCNMFFIFILLYIAFGTILNLHNVKTKEMIINVVIIGLLINFSLFATHVIIDASNILARVFYNSETIKIIEKNTDGSLKEVDTGEYLKLSEAIVSKINPQELILKAGMVGNIPDKGGMSEEVGAGEISLGTLVLVILLASIVNIVGIIVFISVALIFIGRVIGLWLAMIFVPFAFFTYTVPSLQDLEMVGWKKWWPETIKMAFLAPVFMFFMYLIVKFLNLKLDLISTAGKSSMDLVVAILLPFAFIMILLWKAKDIAKKMSGTMGQSITNVIAAVGGVALGAGLGGVAMAMRGTVGRAGSALANSERVKGWEKKGYLGAATLRDVGKFAGKASLDVRGIKIGGKNIGDATGMKVGKVKEGGFEKIKEERIEGRVKRAKELEMGEGSKEKREASELEAKLRAAKAEKATDLSRWEKEVTKQRQELSDAKNADDINGMNAAKTALDNAKAQLDIIKNSATSYGGSISYFEKELNKANDRINSAEISAMNQYASGIESMGNKTINYFKTLGQHSGAGANIAADRIRRGVKIEDKTKH